ncbi:hypothetical protein CEXT_476861 [Caerostris extrusa]|uniref:Uncharacterized protein n=1 Tax=Caerostris extrusa TaxID=172846 RepID=A0AAV4QW69_CAEEX|nr:hypothetical protein CEXT_476861 [Caerostris extrusa]
MFLQNGNLRPPTHLPLGQEKKAACKGGDIYNSLHIQIVGRKLKSISPRETEPKFHRKYIGASFTEIKHPWLPTPPFGNNGVYLWYLNFAFKEQRYW